VIHGVAGCDYRRTVTSQETPVLATPRRPIAGRIGLGVVLVFAFANVAACGDPPTALDAGPVADGAAGADALTTDAAVPDAPQPDAGPAADLIINQERAWVDLAVEQEVFADDACELGEDELCVGGPGLRTLLRFAVETPNIGTADLFLGTPGFGDPDFMFSACHDHFHFNDYAAYALIDAAGASVATGHKQAFCLLDSEVWLTEDPTVSPAEKYSCAYQGIQRGWSDVYDTSLPCQWIDVTDVPPGDYTLAIEINPALRLTELSYDNNRMELPITLGNPALAGPTEPCPDGMSPHATTGRHRECGWTFAGTWDCEPGKYFRIGCAADCAGLGACTGDPMLRVCDAGDPDGNCSATGNLDDSDDACDSLCPRVKDEICPAGGKLAVYHAAAVLGDPYTCDIEIRSAP
jgi:hypothetical protein